MKLSKIVLGSILALVFAAFTSVSFANVKDHDGEIIAYMQAINNQEINVSKIAKDKSVDADVMKFVDMMIDQHGANLQQVTDLSAKINIPADETNAIKKFKEKGGKDLTALSKLDGSKFQKAYIKAMIKGHKTADKMLAHFEVEAQNPELKQYLVATKTAVEEHLAAAKKLK